MTSKSKGVMIVGIEMPKSCSFDCKFRHCTKAYCILTGTPTPIHSRPVNCPLQEVKQYGSSDDCPNDGPTCEGCPIWKKYEKKAEAALDALLGD